MAQYTVPVYAIDSYRIDSSDNDEQRGNTLRSRFYYSGLIGAGAIVNATSSTAIRLVFPSTADQYNKKRFLSRSNYATVYVTDQSRGADRTGSGDIVPDGSEVIYPLSATAVTKNYNNEAWTRIPTSSGRYYEIEKTSSSAYDQLFYPTVAFTTGHWTNIQYALDASYTIYSHTGTYPPYTNFIYEDVIPYATDLSPTANGKVPKFCDNTFSWQFDYDDDNVTAKLTQKSAKFRWRAYGDSTYTELTVGTDKFIKIPKNTFTSQYIEWQVVVTSDDNVAGTPSPWTIANTYVVPYATNMYPNSAGGVAAKHGETTFNWQFSFDTTNVTEPLTQKSAKFRYRPYGVTPYTEVTVGTNQYYKLPAETFSSAFMEWQVALTSSDDVAGAFSAWVKVPTNDTISTPLIRYPVGQIINGKVLNRFAWLHVNSTNTIQTRYEAQYSLNSGTTWLPLSTAITSTQYFDVPADTFPGGNLSWRVRTYNTDNVVGNWSEIATVIVKTTPPTPVIITETISPRPTLAWISSDQQAFEVAVEGYDSGAVYGAGTEYAIPVYLDNGTHTIKVRTQNAYNFWSEWGERTFILDASKPNTSAISIISNYDTGLRLAVSFNTPKCIIYRREFGTNDFYSITTLTDETEYTDYTVASGVRYEYFARAVNADNSFADSSVVDGSIELHCTYIADIENLSYGVGFMLRFDNDPGRDHTYTKGKQYTNFVGREYPVEETDGTKDHTISLSYFIKADLYNSVMALVDASTILYRNELGLVLYGSICSITSSERFYNSHKGYLVSFTIKRVDYDGGGEHA